MTADMDADRDPNVLARKCADLWDELATAKAEMRELRSDYSIATAARNDLAFHVGEYARTCPPEIRARLEQILEDR